MGIAVANHGALYFAIVAFQNEKSGFISLLAYIGLVYAILLDIFFFHESFDALLLVGIIIVFVVNMTLIITKLNAPAVDDVNQKAASESDIEIERFTNVVSTTAESCTEKDDHIMR